LPLVSENDNVSVTTSIFQQPPHQRRSAQLLIAWRQKHNNAIFLTVQLMDTGVDGHGGVSVPTAVE